jgi:hypothetical protein
MSAHPFRSLFIGFYAAALVAGAACSASEDPAADESGIGSNGGEAGAKDKPGAGKGGKGGSAPSSEGGAPSGDQVGGEGGLLVEPGDAGRGGGAGRDAEPGRGGSSGGSDVGSGGSGASAGDPGMSVGGGSGEGPGQEPDPDPVAGSGGQGGRGGEEPVSEAVLRGQALAEENLCVSCHQDDYAGLGFYPNLTSDFETGLGSWSDQDIANAIQAGYDKNGESLCSLMTVYTFTDQEAGDIVAFLRSLPAVSNEITAVCPGHGQ